MADTTLQVRLLHPYKTEAVWSTITDIPKNGEILYTSGGTHDGWYKIGDGVHTWSNLDYVTTTDTKNTAGSTNNTNKLYIIGATSQAANPQTYSNSNFYYQNGLRSHASANDDDTYITQTTTYIDIYVNDDNANHSQQLYMDKDGISLKDGNVGLTISDDGDVNLTGLTTPINQTDAANKKYVDDSISGLSYPVTSVNGQTGAVLLTIPAAQVQSDWNASSGMGEILNKPTLATVATSGSYNDLSNKPAIPTVPTNVSSFTNDSGYLTLATLPKYDGTVV